MDDHKYERAATLREEIKKCQGMLDWLGDSTLVVKLEHEVNHHPVLLLTIGTTTSCEHSLAEEARGFVSAAREKHSRELAALEAECAAL